MSPSAPDRLRALVNDYYHGLVTFDSYRAQRACILDSLGADSFEPSAQGADFADSSGDETVTKGTTPSIPTAAPLPAAAPAAAARRPRAGLLVAAAAVVLIAAAAAAVVLLRPQGDVQAPPVTAEPAAPTSPGVALLEQFVERNVWSRDAVRNLEVAWSTALTEEQRAAALGSMAYDRLAQALRLRLREEQALAGARGSPELQSLADLAALLGMPYAASVGRSEAAPTPTPATRATPEPAPGRRAEAEETVPNVAPEAEPAATAEPPQTETPATAAEVTTEAQGARSEDANAQHDDPPTATASAAAEAPAQESSESTCSATLLNTRRPFCADALANGGQGPALAIVPGGEFTMGSSQRNDEGPARQVTIANPFAMSVYEISFAEFNAYCASTGNRCPENPWSNDAFPVVNVSWEEAQAYTEWLSAQTGQRYRLPSEAEWEYAARAGTQTTYPFGEDVTPAAARSSANGPIDSPVANSDRSVNRNAFRLLHMIGNVREWVADEWFETHAGAPADGSVRTGGQASTRVARGGAYSDTAFALRSASRAALPAGTRDRMTGFRVLRELPR